MSRDLRFADLTETWGTFVSREAAEMISARYHYAAELARGRRVLEIGCGSGLGLGLIARGARTVVGGDPERGLLVRGRQHYGARFVAAQLRAEALPFADASFDLVLCLEALYYVRDAERAFDEVVRVLAPGGVTVFVNANPDRADFIPSPLSHHYHTADEFRAALAGRGCAVTVEGAYAVTANGPRARVRSWARKVAARLGLVPRTLAGRARLKRLAYGHLVQLPAELSAGYGPAAPRVELRLGPASGFKVLYVTAVRAAGARRGL